MALKARFEPRWIVATWVWGIEQFPKARNCDICPDLELNLE